MYLHNHTLHSSNLKFLQAMANMLFNIYKSICVLLSLSVCISLSLAHMFALKILSI